MLVYLSTIECLKDSSTKEFRRVYSLDNFESKCQLLSSFERLFKLVGLHVLGISEHCNSEDDNFSLDNSSLSFVEFNIKIRF